MTHLLLTSNYTESAWLLDLDNTEHRQHLRAEFDRAAHGGDDHYEKFYVIDPKVNDGVPTECQVQHEQSTFDQDQYADASATIYCERDGETHHVTRVGYRIDGRA